MDYKINQYTNWLNQNISLTNAFSEDSMRAMAFHVLMGRNYRLITEKNTKSKLALTYIWLSDVVETAKKEYGDDWKSMIVQDLMNSRHRTDEQKDLLLWLVGLTQKTSVNLGISKRDLPDVMEDLQLYMKDLLLKIDRFEDMDKAWLLMMAGSATLNIRGSDKSKVGKVLEGVIIRSMLSILGLKENIDYWMNIDRDELVERETDCEIRTKRGRIRVEVGLISSGNQEVIEDKINRVGRQGVVLFDKVGANTRIYSTADSHSVKLIQIRGNQPLVEMYRHLLPLVDISLTEPPELEDAIKRTIDDLPSDIFSLDTNNIL
ncbi:MAG: CfrBI family restriction endonuclease [Lachnospiraceae bacterium]|nr:CfrBI family restriction endonuclease [Lachnospiraceae bacterium]